MGCGSSSSKPVSPTPQKLLQTKNGAPSRNHSDTQNNKESKETNGLSHAIKDEKHDNNSNGKPRLEPENNQDLIKPTENQEYDKNTLNSSKSKEINENFVPMSGVAFEVKLDENSRGRHVRRAPKLQKLENVTVLTAEMLAKKQAIAEENRQMEIQRKLAKTSRRKKKLQEARELDRAQEKLAEIEEKMNVQKMKRERIQAGIILKQQQRQLRAQQVRARAEKIREGGDMVELDLDPDNTYNADEEDPSWDTEKTKTNPSSSSLPSSSITQVQEQEEQVTKQTTDNRVEQSVHEFFEE